ncbi:MAG TPA: adenylate/guanylate cyclase domain-containing protein, partial [Baekduia sp.]|nr:adenylate/guanylate cyclase domain-containing protein [Baekduia sp.]
RALALPMFLARASAVRWVVAAVVFGPLGLIESPAFALELFTTLLASALTVAAAEFLIAERVLRRVTALALGSHAPPRAGALGVGPRLVLAWTLCTAVPVVMIALIPVGREVDHPDDLIAPIWFVAAVALGTGLLATKLTTISISRPLRQLRDAADAVAEGDLEVRVAVDDASEVGRLQAGFNAMVDGLRERERLRDLVDRSVGRDVAAEALAHGARLGGEVRICSALFVDVVGSTGLAARERPERVVELLNGFFATVVEVVERHGGFVNKFEGDGALCLFGAPTPCDDHAGRALAAARELQAALARPGALTAAIGVSCGEVVAGWVGAESRFEYTVVGDPVNEASRLTELAKERRDGLLASATTVEVAGEPEASHWDADGEVLLRGRDRPTAIATARRPGERAGTAAAARPASGAA